MSFVSAILEPAPDDWPQRQRIKLLIEAAAGRGLREALLMHSLNIHGSEVWALSAGQLDQLTVTFGAFCLILDEQLDEREVH